jgi:hypothetical protein
VERNIAYRVWKRRRTATERNKVQRSQVGARGKTAVYEEVSGSVATVKALVA